MVIWLAPLLGDRSAAAEGGWRVTADTERQTGHPWGVPRAITYKPWMPTAR